MGTLKRGTPEAEDAQERLRGALLGMAVGDSLGLPMEGMSGRRAARVYPGELRQRLLWGRGMMSDDTEHACMTAQALLVDPRGGARFERSLAWRMRWWLCGLPAAVGWGTLRAICKLWLFVPRGWRGVRSAGNGACMRAPILGAFFARADERERLRSAVRASTRLTHRDARAEAGALAIAVATAMGASGEVEVDADADAAAEGGAAGAAVLEAVLAELGQGYDGAEISELVRALRSGQEHLRRGASAQQYAAALGLSRGVSGYVVHTVPVALYCWLRACGDFRAAISSVISLGGDTDTTAAIVGGMAGAQVGEAGIPAEWLEGIIEWPRSVPWLRRLAARLAAQHDGASEPGPPPTALGPLRLFWPALLVRNAVFLAIALGHGLRRLLPPY